MHTQLRRDTSSSGESPLPTHEEMQNPIKMLIEELMEPAWWDELSDAELLARLKNRGIDEAEAKHVRDQRDREPQIRFFIWKVLGAE